MSGSGRPGALLGVVLAGGRSTRFGSAKAVAEVGGRTMVERALDALAPWVREAGLVLPASPSDDPVPLPPVPVRRDGTPGRGPLEGLRVALAWAEEEECEAAVVLACDLPFVGPRQIGALVRAWRDRPEGATDAVVPVLEGRPQPLVAVYAAGALESVRRRLQGPDFSLRGMLQDLRVGAVPTGSAELPPEAFLNVNTPADRTRATARLAAVEAERKGGVDHG